MALTDVTNTQRRFATLIHSFTINPLTLKKKKTFAAELSSGLNVRVALITVDEDKVNAQSHVPTFAVALFTRSSDVVTYCSSA